MRVSSTELTALYKQALEGCGMDSGVYERAAEMAVWAHAHGINTFCGFQRSLAQCAGLQRANIDVQGGTNGSCRIDVGSSENGGDFTNTTALLWGSLVSDFVAGKAVENGVFVARIEHCRDRLMLLGLIAANHWRGLYCVAYGRQAADPQLMYLLTTPQDKGCPQITHYRIDSQADMNADWVMLVYADSAQLIDRHIAKYCNFDETRLVDRTDSEYLQFSYQQAINEGIEIPEVLHATLTILAARVLVESSEQSRKGAGA